MPVPYLLRRACLLLLLLAGLLPRPHAQQLYAVHDGELAYASRKQPTALVLVEGGLKPTREFFQEFMSNTFRLPFKESVRSDQKVLTALPPTSAFAGRSVELIATFRTVADTTTEVALFGSFTDESPLTPQTAPAEYQLLHQALVRYAPAARAHFTQQQVQAAEDEVAAADKERDQLMRRLAEARHQYRQDSTSLAANGRRGTAARRLVQLRRARLAPTAPH